MSTKLKNILNHVLLGEDEYMTLDFGNQTLNGKSYKHKGIDLISNPNKTNGYDWIVPIFPGTVTAVKNNFTGTTTKTDITGCGNYVIITHSNGYVTRYQHMTKGSINFAVGDKVYKNSVLGYMGATGNVTGRHLHFDIAHNGTYVDPKPYLRGEMDFEHHTYIVMYKTGMNIRSKASSDKTSSVVGELPCGTVFTALSLDSTGKWAKIQQGWVCVSKATYCKEIF